jgi:hypothetical protein
LPNKLFLAKYPGFDAMARRVLEMELARKSAEWRLPFSLHDPGVTRGGVLSSSPVFPFAFLGFFVGARNVEKY